MRDEKQFKKYLTAVRLVFLFTSADLLTLATQLEKEMPQAHLRRVPPASSNKRAVDDSAVGLSGSHTAYGSPNSGFQTMSESFTRPRRNTTGSQGAPASLGLSRHQSTGNLSLRRVASVSGISLRERGNRITSWFTRNRDHRRAVDDNDFDTLRRQTMSPFAKSLRESVVDVRNAGRPRAQRAVSSLSASRPYSALAGSVRAPSVLTGNPSQLDLSYSFDPQQLPALDAHRRALRSWLRDTLSVRTVGHHRETAHFLLFDSFVPKESDMRDMRRREAVDNSRRDARVAVAQGSAERAKVMHSFWTGVQRECIHGDGFLAISEALRAHAKISSLPLRFMRSIEWIRYWCVVATRMRQ